MVYPIKNYSNISGELREIEAALWVLSSICYRGYGTVKWFLVDF